MVTMKELDDNAKEEAMAEWIEMKLRKITMFDDPALEKRLGRTIGRYLAGQMRQDGKL